MLCHQNTSTGPANAQVLNARKVYGARAHRFVEYTTIRVGVAQHGISRRQIIGHESTDRKSSLSS